MDGDPETLRQFSSIGEAALQKIVASAGLTIDEQNLLQCFGQGIVDAETLAENRRISKDKVYRLKYKLKSKLAPLVRELHELLSN